jgi:hypothetical protein
MNRLAIIREFWNFCASRRNGGLPIVVFLLLLGRVLIFAKVPRWRGFRKNTQPPALITAWNREQTLAIHNLAAYES